MWTKSLKTLDPYQAMLEAAGKYPDAIDMRRSTIFTKLGNLIRRIYKA